MRYEVYGVYDDSGTNYGPICIHKSMKSAIESAKLKVTPNCKYWAILVKWRKHTYPFELISGYRGQNPVRATMLVQPNHYGNPITHAKDGVAYWLTWEGINPK